MKKIVVEIGAGELLDRLTILELKARHARLKQQERFRAELADLRLRAGEAGLLAPDFARELSELRATNQALWKIEDEIRVLEANDEFGAGFVTLARSVYAENDRRSRVKRAIDDRYGSARREQKIYVRDARELTGGRRDSGASPSSRARARPSWRRSARRARGL